MHVTRDLSHEVCVIRELFVFGRQNFVFLKFFRLEISFSWSFSVLTSHHLWHLAQSVLWQSVTFEMFLPTSNPQFWACRKFEIQKNILPVQFLSTQGISVTQCVNGLNEELGFMFINVEFRDSWNFVKTVRDAWILLKFVRETGSWPALCYPLKSALSRRSTQISICC